MTHALNPNNHNKRFDDFKASDNFWNNLHEKFHEQIEEMQRSRGLRIQILHILNEHNSKNGVEIMDSIQNQYQSFQMHPPPSHKYIKRPSPGPIYLMLKKMVDEGLIIKQTSGRYELTDRGHKTIYNIRISRKTMQKSISKSKSSRKFIK